MLSSVQRLFTSKAGGFVVGAGAAATVCAWHYSHRTSAPAPRIPSVAPPPAPSAAAGAAATPAPVPVTTADSVSTQTPVDDRTTGAGDTEAKTDDTGAPRPGNDADPAHPGLTVLVQSSFKELVIDATDKDVLVETMLPGCRSCGALTPRVKMLAYLLKDVPTVRVAVMDTEANAPPMEYLDTDATPHLRLFPQDDKSAAVNVNMLGDGGKEGLPTVLELLEFMATHAKTPITITDDMRATAEKMEEEALHLYNCRLVMSSFVNMWRDFSNAGAEAMALDEAAFVAACEDTRDALFVAFNVLDSPGVGSSEKADAALEGVEAVMRGSGVTRAWFNGTWITSSEQYMKEVPPLMAGDKPVVIAFGNGSFETWTSETGKLLRDAERRFADDLQFAHVDCAYQAELCKKCDAYAGAPSLHFYRGESYVSSVYWENPDLVTAMMEALVASPQKAPPLPFLADMEAKAKARRAAGEAAAGDGNGGRE